MRNHDEDQHTATRDLAKLAHDGDALGGIFTRWFATPPIDAADPIELWGARIGRALSVAALAALCAYLIWTYFR